MDKTPPNGNLLQFIQNIVEHMEALATLRQEVSDQFRKGVFYGSQKTPESQSTTEKITPPMPAEDIAPQPEVDAEKKGPMGPGSKK